MMSAMVRRFGIVACMTAALVGRAGQTFGADAPAPSDTPRPIERLVPAPSPSPANPSPLSPPPETALVPPPPLTLIPPLRPPEKHPFRAMVETTLVLAGGFVWYWSNEDFNSADWDLGWDRRSWKRKLTFEALAFDNNEFDTNATSHPKAGISYYIVGRGNNLSLPESLLLSIAASTVWEYGVEYREVPSVNDMVITPLCGMSIGEPIYQFSRFFARSSDGLVTDTLAGILSPINAFNDLIDDNEDKTRASAIDRHGLAADNVHRLDLRLGLASAMLGDKESRTEIDYRIEGYLNNVPRYLTPGAFRRPIYPGEVSQISARLASSSGRVVGVDFASRTNYFGWGAQNFEGTSRADLQGWAGGFALGTAFEYWMRQRQDAPKDELLTANIIGGTGELMVLRGGFRFRLRDRSYLNFGMIHSLAYEDPATRPAGPTKSVLENRGYYYAFGGTHVTEVSVGYRALDLGLEGRVDRFYSIQGLDRNQGQVINDFNLVDRREIGRTFLSLRPRKGFAEISVEVEVLRRTGTLSDVNVHTTERRAQLSLSLVWS
jgi:Domain of unknown function (DUF3943)